MRKELLNNLSEEQIKKASQCKNTDELLALAKKEGYTLSEEQLAAVNGGFCSTDPGSLSKKCPNCGTTVEGNYLYRKSYVGLVFEFICPNCGKKWQDHR